MAETLYVGPPTVGLLGAVDVNVIVCEPLPTLNDCCSCGAAAYSALPAWLASIAHMPAPWKLTVEPEVLPDSMHMELLTGSIVRTTGSPDSPPFAVTV